MTQHGNHPLVRLYRKAKRAKGHDFAQRLVHRYYSARHAEPDAKHVDKYEFREEDHRCGQPENAGEFAKARIGGSYLLASMTKEGDDAGVQ
jgi:hypothetical protein